MTIFTIYASHTCELILCAVKRFEQKTNYENELFYERTPLRYGRIVKPPNEGFAHTFS